MYIFGFMENRKASAGRQSTLEALHQQFQESPDFHDTVRITLKNK